MRDDHIDFSMLSTNLAIFKQKLSLHPLWCSFIQISDSPVIEASYNGHTDTLSLLLLNKANVNAATKAWYLKNIFYKLKTISKYLQYEYIESPHEKLNYLK